MPDGRFSYQSPSEMEISRQAEGALARLQGRTDSVNPASGTGMNSLDILGRRGFPAGDTKNSSGFDQIAGNLAPVKNGVMELNYGDPNFDAKLAQSNYSKVVINGLPKDLRPSPWVDEQAGKGFFFWLKNERNPDASDRSRHYIPSNLKEIEIAQYQGNIYKPVVINADEMRIAASQAYMRKQNDSGFASYKNTTDVMTYAQNMSSVAGDVLAYQEKLLREGAQASPTNPYFHIYLSDVLTAQSIQPVIQSFKAGGQINFDNPQTNAKLDEAIREVQAAREITRRYGDVLQPPAYEMPLSPFSLSPYSYNPDYYWSGASYQAAIREVRLRVLKQLVKTGNPLFQLPPALPPR